MRAKSDIFLNKNDILRQYLTKRALNSWMEQLTFGAAGIYSKLDQIISAYKVFKNRIEVCN